MRWCRIRLVLLGLLLCVVHVVSGTCGQNFVDPSSSALLADVVIEGKVRSTSDPDPWGTFNITVAVKKNILKGGELINKGRPAKTITVDRFQDGGKDKRLCLGHVQKGRTYVFFLKDTQDRKGLYFKIMAMPVKKSKKIIAEVKAVLCYNCAQPPSISALSVPKTRPVDQNITLECRVVSNPPALFTWYKDGVVIAKNSERYQIKNTKRQSTLVIRGSLVKDTGEYECVARNLLGEVHQRKYLTVIRPHKVACETNTFCLNGGSCYHIHAVGVDNCECPAEFEGSRCEKRHPGRVAHDDAAVGQAGLVLERTLIIIGIVIAVLVLIIICIVSYVLAKKARQRFEQRRKRRLAQPAVQSRPTAISVDSRNVSQPIINKHESLIRSPMLPPHMAAKQPGHIMLQDSSPPPVSQSPREHLGESPQQLEHSETKTNPNGNQNDPRGRLAASSVYDNFKSAELCHFLEGGDLHKGREAKSVGGALADATEIKTQSENEMVGSKRAQAETSPAAYIFNTSNQVASPVEVSVSQPVQASDLPPSLPLYHRFYETRPMPKGTSLSSSAQPSSSLNPPSKVSPQRFHDVLSLNKNGTAVQPVIQNQRKHSPENPHVMSQRPFESKSDKDLSRYLPLGDKRQGPYDIHGHTNNISEHSRLLRDLSKLSHSNTFPKPKMNGISSDALSESDEEDTPELPCDNQQLDLYISEEDLCLSKENLVNSSFSSVSAPSRQESREDRGLGLMHHSGTTRPGIRKHQSEENPNYSKIVNRNHAFLQDNARTQSLDNPPGGAGVSRDLWRLNSTVAGSPDVETYDNIVPQPAPQLQNHAYAYDPNDDSTPWDCDMNRAEQPLSLTGEDTDRLHRLKDVLPDQQAIPI